MKKKVSFTFTFNTFEKAKLIAESLSPEVKQKIPKVNIEFSISNNIFLLKIESEDVSALRAACNSYLRWINTAITVNQLI